MKYFLLTLLGSLPIILGQPNSENPITTKDATTILEQVVPSRDSRSEKEVKVIPIEHASAILESVDITVYIDPVGGAEAFEGQKSPDLILITDIHGDHFNPETLEGLNTEKAKIIAPQAVADKMPKELSTKVLVLNNGDTTSYLGVKIEAIPMYNLRSEALHFHPKGRGNGYVINMGGQRIYFSGDTEDIPEMRALKNIDKAFICMNLPYTMTVDSAADAVLAFKPKQVYPYHYRGNPDVSDVGKFKALINQGDPTIEVVQLDWYPKEDY
ncbi:MBL fold metallo-hydrolase [Flavobacteriaceae bacterium F89]|uniref:MBL fold metallo-hydrolase n=1 Tax=Cerina litoralis TaxID=2874477 RepID=A0AAE3ESJ5_9FLAO|nr:MBL fold metallo-hydrolase [Cerina litoralis]MCG2459663.1 MBL fold metallo-hydrolase [Cerina litoralis]